MSNQAEDQSAENQALIDQFVEIAGVDRDRARFYLETAAYDLPLALSGFYEGGFEEDQPEVIFDRGNEADEVQIIEESDDEDDLVAGSRRVETSTGAQRSEAMSGHKPGDKKIATLFSQGGPSRGGESSGDEDEDKGQAFFVGGSEKSGQQVLGPPKKKDPLAEKFFQQARERGAEQIDASQRASAAAGSSNSAFGGAGYRLGDSVKPPEKIGGEAEARSEEPENVTVVLRMYQNGFTLDDEALRTFDQPADRQFLDHIMNGRLPPELIQAHRGKRIDLEMEDHRHEEYKPSKKPVKAFSGQGHTLGSPVPEVIGAGKVGEKAAPHPAPNGASAAAASNVPAVPVDESKPMTNIQIRLGNGDRLVLKLNHNHTVRDLRQFICQARPDLASRAFLLMTSFPNKEITDESSTLEDAKLLNAVIIQRFK